MSNENILGCLGYLGYHNYTTQLCGDYNKPFWGSPLNNRYFMESKTVFFPWLICNAYIMYIYICFLTFLHAHHYQSCVIPLFSGVWTRCKWWIRRRGTSPLEAPWFAVSGWQPCVELIHFLNDKLKKWWMISWCIFFCQEILHIFGCPNSKHQNTVVFCLKNYCRIVWPK